MAGHEERPSDDWANEVAKWTFILAAILTALYVGAVFIYVM